MILLGRGDYGATEDVSFAEGSVNAKVDCLDGERGRQEGEEEEEHSSPRQPVLC